MSVYTYGMSHFSQISCYHVVLEEKNVSDRSRMVSKRREDGRNDLIFDSILKVT